jgi:hypothetical protein
MPKDDWTPQLESEYNTMLVESNKIRNKVEATLRQLKMGGKCWSLRLQIY